MPTPFLDDHHVDISYRLALKSFWISVSNINHIASALHTMPRGRPPKSSTSTPLKRTLSPAVNSTPSTRQSKRLKSSPATNITPKKSQYFEQSPDESDDPSLPDEESGYEDEDAYISAVSSPPSSETEEEDEDNDGVASSSRKSRGKKSTDPRTIAVKPNSASAIEAENRGNELWRPGVKSSLAPGEAVFIKLPKARDDGGVPYEDDRIHPNSMLFLKELYSNNDREWLKVHDANYRASKNDWDTFVNALTEKIIDVDETIPELPAKDLTFRIYRDIRFSPDPTPYKPYFSAAWSRTGRKGPYAGYYVQVQPNGRSFVGAGLWHPDAAPLALLRKDIDRKSHKIKRVLMEPQLRKIFLHGAKNEKDSIKAFTKCNEENMLKTKPKGYEADHPEILLLRLRNFTVGKKLEDDKIVGAKGLNNVLALIEVLVPFVTYLNSVVMPDGPPSSTGSESDAEDTGEDDGISEDDAET